MMQTTFSRLARWLVAGAVGLAAASAPAAAGPSPAPAQAGAAAPLSPEQAAQDVRVLTRALRALHPALTKYRSPAEIDAAFAAFEQRGRAARTPVQMYLAAAELAVAIRCGHTWANVRNQEGAVKAALFDMPDKLPLHLSLVEGRWLVLASATPQVVAGDEVLAVNGVTGDELVQGLLPYVRADGHSDGKRLRQLSHDRNDFSPLDMLLPLLWPPKQGRYALTLRTGQGTRREAAVPAMRLAAREAALAAQGLVPPSEDWSLRIDGDTAVLAMPTWSFWNSRFDWAGYIDQAFERLDREQVPNLVIDIRANEGGDGAIGNRLIAHLTARPVDEPLRQFVSAYERVPYALARHLDTWDFGFFDRTGRVERIAEGTAQGQFALTAKRGQVRRIEPVARPYAGRVFLLVGGENSSATFSFADLVQRHHLATLVGQATGGNQRGLNGGELAWVVLPNSGAAVDIPLLASTYDPTTPDAPVLPDVVVPPRFEARAAGVDLEMLAVRALMVK